MGKQKTIFDYIFLTRPILLIPGWAFLFLGYYRAGGERFALEPKFILIFIIYTMLMAAVYILNQITDIKSDKINDKHLLLAEGILSRREGYIEIGLLLCAAFILSVFQHGFFTIFIIISLILGIMYSAPPFKFKERPIIDFLVNGIGYGFFNFSVGWLSIKEFSLQTIIFSLPYIFGVAAIFINTTILDIKGDELSGSLTTGIYLGGRWALRLSLVFITICAILSLILKDWICFIPAVVSIPLFLYSAIRQDRQSVLFSVGVGGPLLILIIGIIFPYFLVITIIIFIFLRLYYHHRFGIEYPALHISRNQQD